MLFRHEDGQGLAEYAVILSLVALVAIASLQLIGPMPERGIAPAAQALSR